jgi:hypothetical protein
MLSEPFGARGLYRQEEAQMRVGKLRDLHLISQDAQADKLYMGQPLHIEF